MRTSYRIILLSAAALLTGGAASNELSARPARLALRELAAFLQLSAEQSQAMERLRAQHTQQLQAFAQQGRALRGPSLQGQTGRKLQLDAAATADAALCQRSQAQVALHRQQVQALLDPAQGEKLGQLERALALMPMVQAAQAAGLVADRQVLPPLGLPTGSAEVEQSWQRVPAPALPGCSVTQVHRELAPPTGRAAPSS